MNTIIKKEGLKIQIVSNSHYDRKVIYQFGIAFAGSLNHSSSAHYWIYRQNLVKRQPCSHCGLCKYLILVYDDGYPPCEFTYLVVSWNIDTSLCAWLISPNPPIAHCHKQIAHADRGLTASKSPSLSIQLQNGAPSLQSGISRTPEPSIIDNLRLSEAMTVSSSSSSQQYDDEYEYDVLYECQRG